MEGVVVVAERNTAYLVLNTVKGNVCAKGLLASTSRSYRAPGKFLFRRSDPNPLALGFIPRSFAIPDARKGYVTGISPWLGSTDRLQ